MRVGYWLLLWSLAACAALPTIFDVISTALDVAHAGKEAYFARHPNQEAQYAVQEAEQAVRQAELAVAQADSPSSRAMLAESYRRYYQLLHSLGIPEARPPEGGAENDAAATPKPFMIPTPSAVSADLE